MTQKRCTVGFELYIFTFQLVPRPHLVSRGLLAPAHFLIDAMRGVPSLSLSQKEK